MPSEHGDASEAEGDVVDPGVELTEPPPDEPVEIHPHRVVEAILFAADSPMLAAKVAAVLGVGDARDVRKHIEQLNAEYAERGSAFRIEELAGGFQMLTLPAYNTWLRKLLRARQETRLSPAALETLAIVAYKQPCTRAEVEAIRGVAAGDLINRLRDINLLKIVGRAEDLGRPLLYGTTKRFLEVFGLPSLEELPQVEALSAGAGLAGSSREAAPAIPDEVEAKIESASGDEPAADSGAAEGDEDTAEAEDATETK
jgi:segregation and condensation protein B